jgi:hypothetical protein
LIEEFQHSWQEWVLRQDGVAGTNIKLGQRKNTRMGFEKGMMAYMQDSDEKRSKESSERHREKMEILKGFLVSWKIRETEEREKREEKKRIIKRILFFLYLLLFIKLHVFSNDWVDLTCPHQPNPQIVQHHNANPNGGSLGWIGHSVGHNPPSPFNIFNSPFARDSNLLAEALQLLLEVSSNWVIWQPKQIPLPRNTDSTRYVSIHALSKEIASEISQLCSHSQVTTDFAIKKMNEFRSDFQREYCTQFSSGNASQAIVDRGVSTFLTGMSFETGWEG